jgi:hypothetical protein
MTNPVHPSVGLGLPSFEPLMPCGWSTARSEAFHAVAPPGCEPGRIVAATRGFVLAQTASGECWGVPSGRLRERLQRDGLSLCAGDWIILQPNPGPSKASVWAISAWRGEGLADLQDHLSKGRTGVLVGSSGAGKSTLLNALMGSEVGRTQEVRSTDGRGRHTTSLRELFLLPNGGCLIDTPGIREVGLSAEGADLDSAFSDIAGLASGCRFRDCTHGAEPGCAVQAALAEGHLAPERYSHYLRLCREVAFEAARSDEHLWREREEKWRRISKLQKHFKK